MLIAANRNAHAQFTWSAQNSGTTIYAIKDIFFHDLNKGWAVGAGGKIYYTTDGGTNWSQLSSPVSVDLHGICMSSAATGWIVGDNETLLKTTDGGVTWFVAPQPSGSSSHLYDVQFVNQNNGWILGFTDNFRTTDGGVTWLPFDPYSGNTMTDMHFITETKGWICGVSQYLGYTTDGGQTWNQVSTLGTGDIYAVYAHSPGEITIAGSGGYIHKSYDAGVNWNVVNTGAPGAILDMDFMTPEVGLVVGNVGTILATVDGGVTWTDNALNTIDLTCVDLVSNGIGWVGGYYGSIYKSAFGQNDLSIYEYHGLDTLCKNVETPVVLTIYNAGPAPISEADIVLVDGATPFYTYHWSGYMGANTYQDINIGETSVSHSGTYKGVVSGDSVIANNISYKDIVVVQNPVSVSLQSTICAGDSVEIGASGGNSYEWVNASADSTDAHQIVAPFVDQYYFVHVKTDYCTVTDSVKVVVEDCTLPITAISPNGDGKNDFLFIEGLTTTDNWLIIFNRWGDEVRIINNYDNSTVIWDGTDYSGNQVAEGVYYYVFEAHDNSRRIASWVQLIR